MASDLNAGRVRCFDQKHLTLYDMAYNAVWQKAVCHDGMSSRLDSGTRQLRMAARNDVCSLSAKRGKSSK